MTGRIKKKGDDMMKKRSERVVFKGKWVQVKEGIFENEEGREITWEIVERTGSMPTVLIIVPRLVPSGRLVLIKQFRPAINGYLYGFPAGIAETDDLEGEVLRELAEETGYHGSRVVISPRLKTNSGMMNSNAHTALVDIDETDENNLKPRQQLEPEEEIEVVLKRPDELKFFLLGEMEKGIEIGMGLWYFLLFPWLAEAEGIDDALGACVCSTEGHANKSG